MKLELLELFKADEERAWGFFQNGSPMQRAIHNELVRMIHLERDKFETVKAEDVVRLQVKIETLRWLLGWLHRNDKLPTK